MLTPVTKIEPPAWMTRKETKSVMEALNPGGKAPQALFVGGCVRNTLLGYEALDVDIATIYKPHDVIERLEKAGIKAVKTGIEHGTVTAVVDGKPYEVTTLRRDVETDGRRAVVVFSRDWTEDAQRRDFTLNTLLADMDGNIYDPTGEGYEDLKSGRIVFVGSAAGRIAEDYLRVLRFFRFYGYYGQGAPDKDGLSACRKLASKITTLSKERITQEFLKILALPNPFPVTDLMFENGVMADLPAAGYCEATMVALCEMQEQYGDVDLMARLVCLAAFREDHMENMEKYFVLSNAQKKTFSTLCDAAAGVGDMDEQGVKRLVYKYGNDHALQALMLFLAWDDDENAEALKLAKKWQVPDFPLTGDDVMAAGVEKGPRIGKMLELVEDWWIEHDFQPTKQFCIEKLKSLI